MEIRLPLAVGVVMALAYGGFTGVPAEQDQQALCGPGTRIAQALDPAGADLSDPARCRRGGGPLADAGRPEVPAPPAPVGQIVPTAEDVVTAAGPADDAPPVPRLAPETDRPPVVAPDDPRERDRAPKDVDDAPADEEPTTEDPAVGDPAVEDPAVGEPLEPVEDPTVEGPLEPVEEPIEEPLEPVEEPGVPPVVEDPVADPGDDAVVESGNSAGETGEQPGEQAEPPAEQGGDSGQANEAAAGADESAAEPLDPPPAEETVAEGSAVTPGDTVMSPAAGTKSP